MPWGMICDTLAFHHKTMAAGNEAMGAWVRMLSWTQANGMDGFVSAETAAAIASAEVLARLEAAGRIDPAIGGWVLHNHLKYNHSHAEYMARKGQRKDAGKRGGLAKALAGATAGATAGAIAGTLAKTCPIPIPIPTDPDSLPTVEKSSEPAAPAPTLASPSRKRKAKAVAITPDQLEVWEFYVNWRKHLHPSSRVMALDTFDAAIIAARLAEGATVEELKAAIGVMFTDPWNLGRCEKSKTTYLQVEYALGTIKDPSRFKKRIENAELGGAL